MQLLALHLTTGHKAAQQRNNDKFNNKLIDIAHDGVLFVSDGLVQSSLVQWHAGRR